MATATTTLDLLQPRASRGLWSDAAHRLLRNGPAVVGLGLIIFFVAIAILAPVIAPYPANVPGQLANNLQPPTLAHLMGTDKQGNDEFSRILFGSQISLTVGVVAVFLAVPGFLLAILLVSWLGHGQLQIMLAVGVSYSPMFARLLRGSLLALRESDYVTAARSMGASPMRILVRHMIPNALTPLIVQATLAAATAIIDVAGLGFLGLGPGDPRVAEWGEMLTDSRSFLQSAPWLIFFPGAAIVISAVGFNLLGDGLRESLDPRLKR